MYWETVLNEVLNKKSASQPFSFTNLNKVEETPARYRRSRPSTSRSRELFKTYPLGMGFGKIYFTKREAECMEQLLKGKTNLQVAATLALSPRTIEFYVRNMKEKLSCHSKPELIGKVLESEFTKHYGEN